MKQLSSLLGAKQFPYQNHFARSNLEGLKQVRAETLDYTKLADIEQGEKETPDKPLVQTTGGSLQV